ncbi:hypothetical protein V6x_34160 [Gimesia chilikensis]|uniref:Uncharacterized protein n=1 Tax=Gimesia chilikensis TaxID=2605989 RepID=A0A517WEK8_9PLAN|nr:hypothetical protein [Gimesia chilikensis]QDU03693.1 hypothetical protein V6x_34160 [Gimesia chilikensis]
MTEKKKARLLRAISYFVLLLLVIYVFSIGPVVAFLIDGKGNVIHPEYVNSYSAFYAPVIMLVDHVGFIQRYYWWYVNLCNGSEIHIVYQ